MKIAHEHIMKFRTKEFVVIFIFAIVAFMINYLFSLVFDSSYLFIVGVFVLVLLLDLLVYLYKKSLFCIISVFLVELKFIFGREMFYDKK